MKRFDVHTAVADLSTFFLTDFSQVGVKMSVRIDWDASPSWPGGCT
jgi:hypothetical protein